MKLPRRDTRYHTYGEYLTWPDNRREELIDGVAYIREAPAPTRVHQKLLGCLYSQLDAALAGKPYDIYLAPFDVRLPKADEADEEVDTVVQPDILIVRDLDKLDDRGMRGAPDWLAEILSPSTAHHDRVVKLAAYERAGVREVWLVNPMNRTLTLYRLQDGRYSSPILQSLKGRTFLTALPDLHVDWDRLLSRLVRAPDCPT
jgi:Uma2 family endonuclease